MIPYLALEFQTGFNSEQTMASFTSINPDPDSYLKELMWPLYFFSFTLYLLSYAKRQSKVLIQEKGHLDYSDCLFNYDGRFDG